MTTKTERGRVSLSRRLEILFDNRIFTIILPFALLVFVVALFGILTKGAFFSKANIKSIYEQSLVVAVASIGMSFIYTVGNIDVSVGSILCLASAIGGIAWEATGSTLLLMLVTAVMGFLLLQFNCLLSNILHIKAMVASIFMGRIYSAIASELLGPTAMAIDYSVTKSLQTRPIRITFFLVYLIICVIVFQFTARGKSLKFIGGSESCAKTVGLKRTSAVNKAYLYAGIGVGLAAVIMLIRTGTVSVSNGGSIGNDIMLATVLGGMSIYGGHKSSCYAGVLGAFIVIILNKGLLMMGISNTIIQGIRGVIFLIFVYITSEKSKQLPSRQEF